MGAFDSSLAGPPSISPPGIGSNKYDDYDLQALQSVAPQENAPSQPSGGAASQGAFGEPASAGKPQAAFMSGDEGRGSGEARKPISDFHDKWSDSNSEGREAISANMETQFAEQGLSLQGAMNQVFEQGGEPAMMLAEKFGYVNQEQAGKEAFKGREEALSDYGIAIDEVKEQNISKRKKKEQRYAMGGFLMDVGLRILASNRGDGSGAVGEGVLGAQQSRKADKRLKADDAQKAKDRERKIAREDESDKIARNKEDRAASKFETEKDRQSEKDRISGLAQITDEDGLVNYVEIKEGLVVDVDGVPVRKATQKELTAAQEEISKRDNKRTVNKEKSRIYAAIKDGFTDDNEIQAIIDEKDPDKKRSMTNELAIKNAKLPSEGQNETSYEDYYFQE